MSSELMVVLSVLAGILIALAIVGVVIYRGWIASIPSQLYLASMRAGRHPVKMQWVGFPWPPVIGDQRFPRVGYQDHFERAYSWLDKGGQQYDLLTDGNGRFVRIKHRDQCVH